ncbi:MAG: DUF599 family protein [Rhodospirillaceae bacterium]|nr:DUF599 family protein [Rhodospirillaceae bacterium]
MDALRTADYLGLAGFFIGWAGYSWYADTSRWSVRSITHVINSYRMAWGRAMLQREVRVVDTTMVGNILTGIAFFSSTTILIIGGLVALLGARDQAIAALALLPFADTTTPAAWEIKVLLLLTIFVYGFFKFAWAFRLANYCSILIGSGPIQGRVLTPEGEAHACRAAAMLALVARHNNHGFRAYFFALAALGWFVHPMVFVAATGLVIWVIYRREFRSNAYRTLAGDPQAP